MVLQGTSSGKMAPPEVVARYTIDVLSRTIPAAVPGIMARTLSLPAPLPPPGQVRNNS